MDAKTFWLALVASLVMASPLVAAQETKSTDAAEDGHPAWVSDCPPDRMCAMGDGAPASNASDEKPSVDCPPGETCTDKAAGGVRTPSDASSNCMDGEQAGESCRDDVYYMTPPASGNASDLADDGHPSDAQDVGTLPPASHAESIATSSVPSAGLVAVLFVLAGVAVAVAIGGRR